MKKIALALALVLILAALPATSLAAETIVVYNWYDYIDESVISDFEAETGIDVKYANFTTNEEMYAKLSAGAGDYDVIFPSDYIIERLIAEDALHVLDLDAMPNVRGLVEWLKQPPYDPTGEYSVAYMWGTVGVLFNPDLMDEEVTSWASIFDPQYRKGVFMLDSIRDTLGITLKFLGYSLNTREIDELYAARDVLIQQKADGIVKGYLVDEIKDKMVAGEAPMAVIWSGDALYAMSEAEQLEYVVPIEGSNVWVDGMCIPKTSRNVEAAQRFIDFLCRPDIARRNMEYIYYSTPIQAVIDGMDDEERGNLTLNPTQDIIDRCEFMHDISDYMELYNRIWNEIRM